MDHRPHPVDQNVQHTTERLNPFLDAQLSVYHHSFGTLRLPETAATTLESKTLRARTTESLAMTPDKFTLDEVLAISGRAAQNFGMSQYATFNSFSNVNREFVRIPREEGNTPGNIATTMKEAFAIGLIERDEGIPSNNPIPIERNPVHHAKLYRLFSLIDLKAWKAPEHPILQGVVDITGMSSAEITQLSLGNGIAPLLTQEDLRAFVFEELDIFAITHKHRPYIPRHPGYGNPYTKAGLSPLSANMLVDIANANKSKGIRTAVWLDNFHTRLRLKSWGPECLLPYIAFPVQRLEVTDEEREQRMWLCLEKHMMEAAERYDTIRVQDHLQSFRLRESFFLVAPELAMGKFDHLEATEVDDKRVLREWAQRNLELIPFGKLDTSTDIVNFGGSDSAKMQIVDFILNSRTVFSSLCMQTYTPERALPSWRGLRSILKPHVADYIGEETLLTAEFMRVGRTIWFVIPSEKKALVCELNYAKMIASNYA